MGNLNDLINELSAKNFNNIYEELDSTVAMSTRMTMAQKEKLEAICHVFGKRKAGMMCDIIVSAMNDIVGAMNEEQDRVFVEYLHSVCNDQSVVDYIIES